MRTVAVVGAARTTSSRSRDHRRALPDENRLLLELLAQTLVLGARACCGTSALRDRDEDPLALRRLLEEVDRSAARRFDRRRDVAVSRDHQHGRRVVARDDPVEDLEPVHARHLDVEEDGVDASRVEVRERRLPVRRREHLVALVLEDHPQGVADARIVVDDEDLLCHRVPLLANLAPSRAGKSTS